MDFIKELELFLENTPELYGQKLIIVQAMRNPEADPKEINTYFSSWVDTGKKMLCAHYEVEEFDLDPQDLSRLVESSIRQTTEQIKAGQYDDLDSVFNVEESAAEVEIPEVKKAEAAEPESEIQEPEEFPIEQFNDPEVLAKILVDEFTSEGEDNYAEILEEIKESLDYSTAYEWRGMADFTADGTEYTVIRSDDQADLIAIDSVKDSLTNEPETIGEWADKFYYISDTDRNIISNESADFYIDDLSDREVLEQYGEDQDEESVDMDQLREQAKEQYAAQELEKMNNVWQYLNGLGYTRENLPTWVQFDAQEAAEYAVKTDGWEHELSRYDGNYEETSEGLVYFRR